MQPWPPAKLQARTLWFGEEALMTALERPGFLVRRLQQSAVAIFLKEMSAAGHDLTPVQYAVLSAVKASPGPDQATLAGLVALDQATLGGVVTRLLKKEFLTRTVKETDRRSRLLVITEKGLAELAACEPVVDRVQDKILAGLSEPEREQFMRLLAKTVAATNDDSRAPLN